MIHARYVAQWCALAREATALESQVPQSLREARNRALRLSQVYDRWWLLDRDNAELWRRAAPDRHELWARAWSDLEVRPSSCPPENRGCVISDGEDC